MNTYGTNLKPYISKSNNSYTVCILYYHKDEKCYGMNAMRSSMYFDLLIYGFKWKSDLCILLC